MPPAETPAGSAVPLRVLGQYLRELRRQAGLTVKLAAQLMEWSEPKLWRIETGQTALRILDVQAMCAAYGAEAGPDAGIGRAGCGRPVLDGWWCAYGGEPSLTISASTQPWKTPPAHSPAYAPSQVPSLLRTEAYARTLIASTGLDGEEADRLVYDCLARRVLLTRAQRTA